MKVKIDIILGFLGSGKTTLINSILKSNKLKDEINCNNSAGDRNS